jgi:hypothetical protein
VEIDEIKKVLWKLSIEFLRSNALLSEFTYEDLINELYMSSKRRHIIGDLQLFEVYQNGDFIEATFQFSPNYLNREVYMLYAGMGEIKWKLLLSTATVRVGLKNITEDTLGIQEEIVHKISNSKIEIISFKSERVFSSEEFINSIKS